MNGLPLVERVCVVTLLLLAGGVLLVATCAALGVIGLP
jgi:hypothetical protein